jgi:hypothetical protein
MDLVTAVADVDAAVLRQIARAACSHRAFGLAARDDCRLTSVMRRNGPMFGHSSIRWADPVAAAARIDNPQRKLTTLADAPLDNLSGIV